MNKQNTKKNVYELTQERLRMIFNEFDNIYVSFSGGKDSGILLELCIDYIRKNNLNRKIGVFHMDYEIQYRMTIDYVDRILEANKDILEVYRVCVPFKVRTCTSMYQQYWRPWEKEKEDMWVRQMPKGVMTQEDFPFYNENMWDYNFQIEFAKWLHQKKMPFVPAVWSASVPRKAIIAGGLSTRLPSSCCIIITAGVRK